MIKMARDQKEGERGAVLLVVTLSVIILIAFAALTIDVGFWYVHQNRLRMLSEAASLGGAAYMPDKDKAAARVQYVLEHEGYTGVTVSSAGPIGFPNTSLSGTISYPDTDSVSVTIVDNSTPTFFSGLFLGSKLRTMGTATSAVGRPVALGSPTNHYGTSTFFGAAGSSTADSFWASIDGYCNAAENGESITTRWDFNETVINSNGTPIQKYWGCTQAQLAAHAAGIRSFDNLTYTSSTDHSYYYVIQQPPMSGGTASYRLYVYSPSYAYEDPTWIAANRTGGTGQTATFADRGVPGPLGGQYGLNCSYNAYPYLYDFQRSDYPSGHDTRQTHGTGQNQCLSAAAWTDATHETEQPVECDANLGPVAAGGDGTCPISVRGAGRYEYFPEATTTYSLYDVDGPLTNPILTPHNGCEGGSTKTYGTRDGPKSNAGNGYPLYAPNGSFKSDNRAWEDTQKVNGANVGFTWDNLCTIPFSPNARYILQVNTKTEINSAVTNLYSLLMQDANAGQVTSCDSRNGGDAQTCPRIYSKDNMHVKFSVPNTVDCPVDSQFSVCADLFLAEFPKEFAGRNVQIKGWDVGDGMSNVELLTPDKNVMNKDAFQASCSITAPANIGGSSQDCSLSGGTINADICDVMQSSDPAYPGLQTFSGFEPITNRKFLTINMKIPENYDPANYNGNDWFYIRYAKRKDCNKYSTPGNAFSAPTITDNTVWNLTVLGSPIRVID
jgi:hypothetical protein